MIFIKPVSIYVTVMDVSTLLSSRYLLYTLIGLVIFTVSILSYIGGLQSENSKTSGLNEKILSNNMISFEQGNMYAVSLISLVCQHFVLN